MVPSGARVADIGSGHGILARWLLETGRASFCIASEVDAKALARVAGYVDDDPMRPTLERRSGNGLSVIRPEDRVDVVVIAGLGGGSIRRILESGLPLGVRRLVLQPQTHAARLRRWLCAHGLAIVEERLVEESGRFYATIAAEPGQPVLDHPSLSAEDLFAAGPCLVRDPSPVVRAFWTREEKRLRAVIAGMPTRRVASLEAGRRLHLARRILAALPSVTSGRA
jgi:tRNA (adenine22-N1)-methyltransferase